MRLEARTAHEMLEGKGPHRRGKIVLRVVEEGEFV